MAVAIQMSAAERAQRNAQLPKTFQMPHIDELEDYSLYKMTLGTIHQYWYRGCLPFYRHAEICLERIHRINPYLEAVIETNPEALDIALDLDKEYKNNIERGPLMGIPVLVKDNMATRDLMQTTAGSWALLSSTVPRDAHTVSLLREAGAVIIGHANMSEWASLRSKKYSTGYSPRGGQTRNPYDLATSPWGSSSGCAVAVSANIVPLAFGTETDSSIIGCALYNGVVGIKPTVGLTSRAGIIPISKSMDTVGVFARNVGDAVWGLGVIAGPDPRDPVTMLPDVVREDYTAYRCNFTALRGATFGIP